MELKPGPSSDVSTPMRRWMTVASGMGTGMLSGLGGRATSLIYPPSCIACRNATSQPHGLCAACWSGMGFITRPYCKRLGTPFAVDLGGDLISPQAMADPPVFERARAVARYDDTARELVHRLKYGDRLELAKAMAQMMVLAGHELVAQADVVVPVPLHRFRLWSRRFNQAAALARQVGTLSGKPVALQGLSRVRSTRPQVGLTRDQRRLNLQGAFRPGPDAALRIEGRRVLLVDDVLTTGSTANAASRALLRAGAVAVDVLTFARVVPGDA